jgi:uncharacterized protein YodC (DUF2158 family)
MSSFDIGDLVVLKSGSMRMCVEAASDDSVSCVWCHEGRIGRDSFHPALLSKWEAREDHGRPDRGAREGGPRGGANGGGKPHRGQPDRGGRDRDRDRDDRPPRKTGWDGKPREKKYFRKDDG